MLALISNSAQLIAENQAIKSQAESANKVALESLKAAVKATDNDDSKSKKVNEETLKILKLKEEECDTLKRNLNTAKLDLDTMKKQSESLAREYDNLLKDHAKLTSKLERLEYSQSTGGAGGGKKSN